jgi:hypothetical protein
MTINSFILFIESWLRRANEHSFDELNGREGMEGVVGIVRDTMVCENYYCNKRPQDDLETNETA